MKTGADEEQKFEKNIFLHFRGDENFCRKDADLKMHKPLLSVSRSCKLILQIEKAVDPCDQIWRNFATLAKL